MPSIITHALTGSLISAVPARKSHRSVRVGLAIGGFILGALPDLLTYLYHIWYTPDQRWFFYQAFHSGSLWWSWIVPPYFIHVLLDMVSHDANGWAWWAYVIEVLFWPANILGLWWVFKK